jgi:hypothetical protein
MEKDRAPLRLPPPPSGWFVDGTRQLVVNLVEVNPNDAVGSTHTVTRQLSVGDQSAHHAVTNLQVLGGFRDGDVTPCHAAVQALNLPSCSKDSRSIRMALVPPIRRASSYFVSMSGKNRLARIWEQRSEPGVVCLA